MIYCIYFSPSGVRDCPDLSGLSLFRENREEKSICISWKCSSDIFPMRLWSRLTLIVRTCVRFIDPGFSLILYLYLRGWGDSLDVSGTHRNISWLNFLRIRTGRSKFSCLPSCSKPIFSPILHHQISRSRNIGFSHSS